MKLRITISKISLVVFMPNITTNHAITYTNKIYKNLTTKYKLNLLVEVKSLWVFLIFKNCFLRRTVLLPYSNGSACLTVCYYEKKEWLVLLIKVEPPIRLELIKSFSWKQLNVWFKILYLRVVNLTPLRRWQFSLFLVHS